MSLTLGEGNAYRWPVTQSGCGNDSMGFDIPRTPHVLSIGEQARE